MVLIMLSIIKLIIFLRIKWGIKLYKLPDGEDLTVNLAKKVGLTYKGELKLSLSALNAGGFKYEPIFLFIKEQ